MSPKESTSVLIVGGGLVGLTAALLLQYHGVDFVLVERRAGASVLPRSRGLHTRTSEIFRQLDVEDRVQEAAARALKAGQFGGFHIGATMLSAAPQSIGAPTQFLASASPSAFTFLPQVDLEPLLIDIARDRGADLRFDTEMTSLTALPDGVEVILTQSDGRRRLVAADYVIAADGANSGIRRSLGIDCWQLPPTHHYVNVFFRADLAERVAGNTFSQCQIDNDDVHALMLAKNNTDEWSLHIEYDPTVENLADYPVSRCVELVHAAIGASDVEVTVLARACWDTGVHVANEYRSGRVLLAGDAAHRHAPFGGFGANTGIADVHNLVWKLAAVLGGRADDALVDTYVAERRPRAVTGCRQARLRTDLRTRFAMAGANGAPPALLDIDTVTSRFRYHSPAIIDPTPGDAHVDQLQGQPGTRVPHMWLAHAGQEISTLDLCGPGFTLITDVDADSWIAAADHTASQTGHHVTVHAIGPDVDGAWRTITGLPNGGALLVRPDRHVAARSDHDLSPAALPSLLASIHEAVGATR